MKGGRKSWLLTTKLPLGKKTVCGGSIGKEILVSKEVFLGDSATIFADAAATEAIF